MNYIGVIIEESLAYKSVLKSVKILSTKVSDATKESATPHLKQWTLHTVRILESKADAVAKAVSQALDITHNDWYADFKNDTTEFIIFHNQVFKIDRTSQEQYNEAKEYGLSLGIPDYQMDFKAK